MVSQAQAGDDEIQASVKQMRCVIELARNIRDRHNKPLKQPMRRITISHSDAASVASLACPTTLPQSTSLYRGIINAVVPRDGRGYSQERERQS